MIALENVTIRLYDRFILPHTFWRIKRGENWAVIGQNGSGKSTLVRTVAGMVSVARGSVLSTLSRPIREAVGYVSFEVQRDLVRWELDQDEARHFSNTLDGCATARQVIFGKNNKNDDSSEELSEVFHYLQIDHLLDRRIRFFSTGEMRNVVIARALAKKPDILILDEPFDGLDVIARSRLSELIEQLMQQDIQIILVTHRVDEIPSGISNIICVKETRIVNKGRKEDILFPGVVDELYNYDRPLPFPLCAEVLHNKKINALCPRTIVEMKDVTIYYDNIEILKNINWTVQKGEHWAIVGENGSGKTTLLDLITGNNPQVYANNVKLFGKQRGTGETLAEVKKRIGFVSFDLQISYQRPVSVFHVVLSGFFDSVGLYRYASPEQREQARKWLAVIGMKNQENKRFDHCSYGEQRLVLIARSMVKVPVLLILDEPCEGLDEANRKMVLKIINAIAVAGTHILYVTHRENEVPDCITHYLMLKKTGSLVKPVTQSSFLIANGTKG